MEILIRPERTKVKTYRAKYISWTSKKLIYICFEDIE